MGDIDALFVVGDLVYEYRFQPEVIDLLRERDAFVVQGNHDHVLLKNHGARLLASGEAQPHHLSYLGDAPTSRSIDLKGKRIFMTHASPWDPFKEYLVPSHPKLARFEDFDADFVLLGHTHQPMVQRFGKTLVVNSGSCGITRHSADFNLLTCAVIELESEEAQIIHFPDPRFDPSPSLVSGANGHASSGGESPGLAPVAFDDKG
jgi:putative phosphoesterase